MQFGNTATTQVIGHVHSTESFGSVDGPGIRFITFMQGCRLRCEFCHNPDTWATRGGHDYTPQQLFDEAVQYQDFWGKKGGVVKPMGSTLLWTHVGDHSPARSHSLVNLMNCLSIQI